MIDPITFVLTPFVVTTDLVATTASASSPAHAFVRRTLPAQAARDGVAVCHWRIPHLTVAECRPAPILHAEVA